MPVMVPTLALEQPTFEHHPDGFGVHYRKPRISWRFIQAEGDQQYRGWVQTAYDLEVSRTSFSASHIFHVESEQSILVPWPAESLRSREAVTVRVRAYGKFTESCVTAEANSAWSAPATVEAALLDMEDWIASFITSRAKFQGPNSPLRPVRFRKSFSLPPKRGILRARLYVTAYGVYEAYINGTRVGNHTLAPGWQSYRHRLHYQTFDVSSLLNENNTIGIEAGEGWYASRLGFFGGSRYIYGDEIAVLAQLEIILLSGESIFVKTDETWTCSPSPILTSEIYDGEVCDLRLDNENWTSFELDQAFTTPVRSLPPPKATLVAPDAPPVRVTQEVEALNVFRTKSGKTIVDFGQNLAGVVRIRSLLLPAGKQVTLTHAEVMENGELGIRPLRHAKARDVIISSGKEILSWSPKFTFHGFRYVQVDGWPGSPRKEDLTALVIHTDMRRRGWFTCSNPMINKLHQNAVWSMRSNFVSLPTDCPQRDERLGWTGDIQAFCPSACFLFNVTGALGNWLQDLASEQLARDDGVPGMVVPNVLPASWHGVPQAIWGDAAILTPWELYRWTSDKMVLKRQYDSMKAWLDIGIPRDAQRLWDPRAWQWGDWLDPTAPANEPGNSRTDSIFVANAFLVHATSTMATICDILGYKDEAQGYAAEVDGLKASFQHHYISPSGGLVNNTQTAISLAVSFKLYRNASELRTASQALSRLVRSSKFKIATGFAGTPFICHALTKTDQPQLAYRMLLEKECPSWLYPITMGSTTIWERWDSILSDGSINPGWMTSFNHYALGSVVDWLHTTVAGLSSEDGWKTILVKPIPGGDLTSAEGIFEGPYGRVEVNWEHRDGCFNLTTIIPPNCIANVVLPRQITQGSVTPLDHPVTVGSGKHSFTSNIIDAEWPPKPIVPFYETRGELVWGFSEGV